MFPTTRIPAPASSPERDAATATSQPPIFTPFARGGGGRARTSQRGERPHALHTCVCIAAGDTEKNEGDGMSAKKGGGRGGERERETRSGWSVGRTPLVPRTRLVPKLAMHLPSLRDSYPSCGKNSPVRLHRDASLSSGRCRQVHLSSR